MRRHHHVARDGGHQVDERQRVAITESLVSTGHSGDWVQPGDCHKRPSGWNAAQANQKTTVCGIRVRRSPTRSPAIANPEMSHVDPVSASVKPSAGPGDKLST